MTINPIDCEALARGGQMDLAVQISDQGLCLHQQPDPVAAQEALAVAPTPVSSTSIASMPIASPPPSPGLLAGGLSGPMVVGGALVAAGFAIWKGMEYLPRYDAERRARLQPAALPGAAYTQATLPNATAGMPMTQGIQPHTPPRYTESGAGHTAPDTGLYAPVQGREIGVTEPSPFMATEEQRANYQEDRVAVMLETPEAYLRRATVEEFKGKIPAGEIDPVAALEQGVGLPKANEAMAWWFSRGIAEVGKVGWAVYGSDGQGGSSRARATAQLVRRGREHFQAKTIIPGEE